MRGEDQDSGIVRRVRVRTYSDWVTIYTIETVECT